MIAGTGSRSGAVAEPAGRLAQRNADLHGIAALNP
jgi:hypothetical protein